MKHIMLLLICWSVATSVLGQVRLETKLDSIHIMIGDQMQLHLTLSQNEGYKATFPTTIDLGDSIEILSESGFDTIMTSPALVIEKHLTITSFDSGLVRIPPVSVAFSKQNGDDQQMAFSKPLYLHVATVAVSDSAQIKGIKGIIEEAANWQDYAQYMITAGVLLVIGFIIWFLMRRGKTEELPIEPEVIRPPYQIALEKLSVLHHEELWQKGQIKTYQSRLTDIIREYIEGRYQIRALESTTFEIMAFLKDKNISTELKTKLREMLEVADLVKFAKAEPPENIHEKLMEDAVSFVKTTKEVIMIE